MAFACLFVPDFPVQAVARLEPELRDEPVAIFAGTPPLTKVFALNDRARALGLAAGMTRIQTETYPGFHWRWRSLSQEDSAHAALVDCAWTVSPRLEEGRKRGGEDLRDTVILDIAGCERLRGSTEKIAHDLVSAASQTGLQANVAIAGNPDAAISAAKGFPGITVIPTGEEGARIGALSLAGLRVPGELRDSLKRWGIHTCAEFAALNDVAIVERLGQEGLLWHRLARGEGEGSLIAADFPSQFEERMELDSPVELLEPLLFILNRLLEQLCVRLRMHLLAIGEVQITLALQGDDARNEKPQNHVRTLRLPVPADPNDGKQLLRLMRLDLEGHTPSAAVSGVTLSVIPAGARARQLGLFIPQSPDPRSFEITLARLVNTVGEGRVGSPQLLDSHRPNAFVQKPFVLQDANSQAAPTAEAAPTALRLFRPALRVQVKVREGKPTQLTCDGNRAEIVAFAGPWRTKGEWWSEKPWARDEWDIEVRDLFFKKDAGAGEKGTKVYRVYQELRANQWFVEGIYD